MGMRARHELGARCPRAIAPRSKRPALAGESGRCTTTCSSRSHQFLAKVGVHRHGGWPIAPPRGPPSSHIGTKGGVGPAPGPKGNRLAGSRTVPPRRSARTGAQGGIGGMGQGLGLLCSADVRRQRASRAIGRHPGFRCSSAAGLQPQPAHLSHQRALLAPQAPRPQAQHSWAAAPEKKTAALARPRASNAQ